MMKGIGLLLSAAALILTAFQSVARQKKQLDTLREICAALEQMAAELGEHSMSLPELMDELSGETSTLLRPFFTALTRSLQDLDEHRFSESWRQAVDRQLFLRAADKTALYRLGSYLGRYSGQMQSDAVLSVRAELFRELQRREASASDKRRLTAALTAAAICMLFILNL